MNIKPILFSTEMVQAILEARKTATRRLVKAGNHTVLHGGTFPGAVDGPKYGAKLDHHGVVVAPYQPGDILYVRETYSPKYYDKEIASYWNGGNRIVYKADWEALSQDAKDLCAKPIWKPSIHMPREAARIWLRVTDVRVERLREISVGDILHEGIDGRFKFSEELKKEWSELWNSTIKLAARERYGWAANPWVWVIEFERCEKPEGWPG